ncbi:S8 family serine peptidase [Saccharothrix luteola]|uniref:S8 family serine peptidase n=1 Tax=Saccharothrix luteola TaxID=2893018 RepID=UPI001E5B8403|nr:S8 family serine peptidase [Saccharothrix luteola]MCC8247658.1 S8 family serine peptidase [Saccharothrix luteola]
MNAGSPDAVEGSYIVVLRDGARAGSLTTRPGLDVIHRYSRTLNGFAAHMDERTARSLAADPAVAYVAQDQVVHLFGDQSNPPSWGLDRIDQLDRPLNGNYGYGTTASSAHVYVIDTGIRVTHSDFGGRATFDVNTTRDGINSDCHADGHGTHIAGTVGGAAHGVAKGVRLHAVKVVPCVGSGAISDVVAGVEWVTANRIQPAVVNMSIGMKPDAIVETAVRNSIASGITYVAAAGNSDLPACASSPGRMPEVITVAATDPGDNRLSYSNWGTCVDLFAPGGTITSTSNAHDWAVATMGGTSMAAPHVTGAAALFLAANPGATPQQVANVLLINAAQNKVLGAREGSPNLLLYSRTDLPPQSAPDRLLRGEVLQAGQSKVSRDSQYTLAMQGDGNLVLYGPGSQALWSSGTAGSGATYAVLQNDGNLVVYTATGIPRFHTVTQGTTADRLLVQTDANLVLYGPAGQVFWIR